MWSVAALGKVAGFLLLTLAILTGGVRRASAQQISKDEIKEMGIEEYKQKVKEGVLEGPDTTGYRHQLSPHQSLSLRKTPQETNSGLRVPLDSSFSVVRFDGEGGAGEADPDDPLQRNDDDVTDSLDIGFEFNFYGSNYRYIFVNNNGNITLGESQPEYDPVGFPSGDYRMIAPFWADVDTRDDSSGVVYRRTDSDQIIITWNEVGYFGQNADKLNTFQVIISNGEGANVPDGKNVCFSYADMQWTTGDFSGGSDGFGGSPATAGVNKGADSTFALVGRFDQPGDSYDGPGGDPDGVDYLDNQEACFDTRTASNNLPPITQNAPTSPVPVQVGDTVSGSVEFLSPESGQVTSVSVTDQPPNFEATTTDGNPARVEYSFTPSREQAGQSFPVPFTATDDGQPSQSETVTLTLVPVEITLNEPEEVPDRGNDTDVIMSVSEGLASNQVQLFHRPVGMSEFQASSLGRTSPDTYAGTLPAEAVTERGLEYYALISDENATTIPASDPTSQPLHAPVRISGIEAGIELEAGQYRMVSAPVRLDTTTAFTHLRDDFGGLDRTAWRLLRWNPETADYDEVTTEDRSGDLVPGHAYWLITEAGETQDGQSTFDVGSGLSVPPEPIQIELSPGWTQMANPRSYPVAWSAVNGSESVMNPVAYDPSAPDSADFDVDVLRSWTGYWVYNPGSSTVQIGVPSPEVDGGSPNVRTAMDQTEDEPSLFDSGMSYAVRVRGTLKREGERALRDPHTVAGVGEDGQPGVGVEDVAAPPPIGDRLRINIVEEETRLAGSLRPSGKAGYAWNLEVKAPEGERGRVRGEVEPRGALPPGFEYRFVDRETGRRIPVEGGAFTVQLTDERPVRRLRLIVGSEAFARAESEAIEPERTGLRAVYPNPTRGAVSVDYHLKAAQRVQIEVYDLLGRRVRTLVDGRRPVGHHTARWDGRSGSGPVASGTYFVQMRAESTTASRRVVLLR